MRVTRVVLGALLVAAAASAQEPSRVRFELRPFAGRFVPLGEQGQDFRSATSFGFQGAVEMSRYFHFLGSGSLTESKSKIGALIQNQTRLWQYDVGAEFNDLVEFGNQFMLRPFVGLGVGARTFWYKEPGVTNSTSAAGYVTFGTELQRGMFALRFEGREYASQFESPFATDKRFRNDVTFMFGLALHLN